MAKYVKPLLDVILSSEFSGILNDDGNVVGPQSQVYKTISNRMDDIIKPEYIYTMVKNNRHNLLDEILKFFGTQIERVSNSFSEGSSFEHEDKENFTIFISHDIWMNMLPETIIYSDNKKYNCLKREVWTDKLYQMIYEKTKFPCALTFKRCKISEISIYVVVEGTCEECGCKFTGNIINKPTTESTVIMECCFENFDFTIEHSKKRQLKGQRRVEICKTLVEGNKKPCVLRRDLADKLMEFGDAEPAHLPKSSTLRKAKQESRDKSLGVIQGIDPLKRIMEIKLGQYAGSIHGVGADPFFVHYWTIEQMATYVLYPHVIYIDATGSVVKKIKKANGELSPHIYLYQIVCKTPTAKMPIFQMLSAVQNTNAIQYWLFEILRIGSLMKSSFPQPQEIICDFDKALMGAVARAFGQCSNLRDYLSRCLLATISKDANSLLPRCYLRLDICHYVALVARWKELQPVNPIVRKFYIRVMCLLTKTTTLVTFQKLVKSAIIICHSETCGKTQNGANTLAEEARIFIFESISGIPNLTDRHDEITENLLLSEEESDEQEHNGSDTIDTWANQFFQECMDEARQAKIGIEVNAYYCPQMLKKFKYMLPYFPLYSGVMISTFGFGKVNASSAAVESEFHDIKRRVFSSEFTLPLRVDKFLIHHLRSFSGKAKLAVASFHKNLQNTDRNTVDDNILNDFQCVNTFQDGSTKNKENDEKFTTSDELAAEQNWRNKNPTKKIKLSYVDPFPDWNLIQNTKSGHKMDLLLNGNICSLILERKSQIVVKNTCGFDSVMQILGVACRNDKFHNYVNSSKSSAFSFLQLFLRNGSCAKVYKQRANILRTVQYFVSNDDNVPGKITIDASSNISNLCEYVFHCDWSVMENFTCTDCKKNRNYKKVLAPININIVNEHSFSQLEEALRDGGMSKRTCCGSAYEVVVTYGSHIFIECEVNRVIPVEEFPTLIRLHDRTFQFAGLVMYSGDTDNINSIGHYTAWVKRGVDWIEFDDLIKKFPLAVKFPNNKTPRLCIYVEI